MGTVRTWDCLNRNCRLRFDAEGEGEKCPSCGGTRHKWVPVQLNYSTKAPVADKDVRDLTKLFGMTDINSPMRDRAAKMKQAAPKTMPYHPAGAPDGWSIPVAVDAQGRPVASCAPSGMTSKLKGPVSPDRAKRFEPSDAGRGLKGPVPDVVLSDPRRVNLK